MPHCLANGCKNNSDRTPSITLHAFPKDAVLAKAWALHCGAEDIEVLVKDVLSDVAPKYYLCSEHIEGIALELKPEIKYVPSDSKLQQVSNGSESFPVVGRPQPVSHDDLVPGECGTQPTTYDSPTFLMDSQSTSTDGEQQATSACILMSIDCGPQQVSDRSEHTSTDCELQEVTDECQPTSGDYESQQVNEKCQPTSRDCESQQATRELKSLPRHSWSQHFNHDEPSNPIDFRPQQGKQETRPLHMDSASQQVNHDAQPVLLERISQQKKYDSQPGSTNYRPQYGARLCQSLSPNGSPQPDNFSLQSVSVDCMPKHVEHGAQSGSKMCRSQQVSWDSVPGSINCNVYRVSQESIPTSVDCRPQHESQEFQSQTMDCASQHVSQESRSQSMDCAPQHEYNESQKQALNCTGQHVTELLYHSYMDCTTHVSEKSHSQSFDCIRQVSEELQLRSADCISQDRPLESETLSVLLKPQYRNQNSQSAPVDCSPHPLTYDSQSPLVDCRLHLLDHNYQSPLEDQRRQFVALKPPNCDHESHPLSRDCRPENLIQKCQTHSTGCGLQYANLESHFTPIDCGLQNVNPMSPPVDCILQNVNLESQQKENSEPQHLSINSAHEQVNCEAQPVSIEHRPQHVNHETKSLFAGSPLQSETHESETVFIGHSPNVINSKSLHISKDCKPQLMDKEDQCLPTSCRAQQVKNEIQSQPVDLRAYHVNDGETMPADCGPQKENLKTQFIPKDFTIQQITHETKLMSTDCRVQLVTHDIQSLSSFSGTHQGIPGMPPVTASGRQQSLNHEIPPVPVDCSLQHTMQVALPVDSGCHFVDHHKSQSAITGCKPQPIVYNERLYSANCKPQKCNSSTLFQFLDCTPTPQDHDYQSPCLDCEPLHAVLESQTLSVDCRPRHVINESRSTCVDYIAQHVNNESQSTSSGSKREFVPSDGSQSLSRASGMQSMTNKSQSPSIECSLRSMDTEPQYGSIERSQQHVDQEPQSFPVENIHQPSVQEPQSTHLESIHEHKEKQPRAVKCGLKPTNQEPDYSPLENMQKTLNQASQDAAEESMQKAVDQDPKSITREAEINPPFTPVESTLQPMDQAPLSSPVKGIEDPQVQGPKSTLESTHQHTNEELQSMAIESIVQHLDQTPPASPVENLVQPLAEEPQSTLESTHQLMNKQPQTIEIENRQQIVDLEAQAIIITRKQPMGQEPQSMVRESIPLMADQVHQSKAVGSIPQPLERETQSMMAETRRPTVDRDPHSRLLTMDKKPQSSPAAGINPPIIQEPPSTPLERRHQHADDPPQSIEIESRLQTVYVASQSMPVLRKQQPMSQECQSIYSETGQQTVERDPQFIAVESRLQPMNQVPPPLESKELSRVHEPPFSPVERKPQHVNEKPLSYPVESIEQHMVHETQYTPLEIIHKHINDDPSPSPIESIAQPMVQEPQFSLLERKQHKYDQPSSSPLESIEKPRVQEHQSMPLNRKHQHMNDKLLPSPKESVEKPRVQEPPTTTLERKYEHMEEKAPFVATKGKHPSPDQDPPSKAAEKKEQSIDTEPQSTLAETSPKAVDTRSIYVEIGQQPMNQEPQPPNVESVALLSVYVYKSQSSLLESIHQHMDEEPQSISMEGSPMPIGLAASSMALESRQPTKQELQSTLVERIHQSVDQEPQLLAAGQKWHPMDQEPLSMAAEKKQQHIEPGPPSMLAKTRQQMVDRSPQSTAVESRPEHMDQDHQFSPVESIEQPSIQELRSTLPENTYQHMDEEPQLMAPENTTVLTDEGTPAMASESRHQPTRKEPQSGPVESIQQSVDQEPQLFARKRRQRPRDYEPQSMTIESVPQPMVQHPPFTVMESMQIEHQSMLAETKKQTVEEEPRSSPAESIKQPGIHKLKFTPILCTSKDMGMAVEISQQRVGRESELMAAERRQDPMGREPQSMQTEIKQSTVKRESQSTPLESRLRPLTKEPQSSSVESIQQTAVQDPESTPLESSKQQHMDEPPQSTAIETRQPIVVTDAQATPLESRLPLINKDPQSYFVESKQQSMVQERECTPLEITQKLMGPEPHPVRTETIQLAADIDTQSAPIKSKMLPMNKEPLSSSIKSIQPFEVHEPEYTPLESTQQHMDEEPQFTAIEIRHQAMNQDPQSLRVESKQPARHQEPQSIVLKSELQQMHQEPQSMTVENKQQPMGKEAQSMGIESAQQPMEDLLPSVAIKSTEQTFYQAPQDMPVGSRLPLVNTASQPTLSVQGYLSTDHEPQSMTVKSRLQPVDQVCQSMTADSKLHPVNQELQSTTIKSGQQPLNPGPPSTAVENAHQHMDCKTHFKSIERTLPPIGIREDHESHLTSIKRQMPMGLQSQPMSVETIQTAKAHGSEDMLGDCRLQHINRLEDYKPESSQQYLKVESASPSHIVEGALRSIDPLLEDLKKRTSEQVILDIMEEALKSAELQTTSDGVPIDMTKYMLPLVKPEVEQRQPNNEQLAATEIKAESSDAHGVLQKTLSPCPDLAVKQELKPQKDELPNACPSLCTSHNKCHTQQPVVNQIVLNFVEQPKASSMEHTPNPCGSQCTSQTACHNQPPIVKQIVVIFLEQPKEGLNENFTDPLSSQCATQTVYSIPHSGGSQDLVARLLKHVKQPKDEFPSGMCGTSCIAHGWFPRPKMEVTQNSDQFKHEQMEPFNTHSALERRMSSDPHASEFHSHLLLAKEEPVTFEDVAVCFSKEEWEILEEWQKTLYKDVMKDNYEILFSLGYPVPKPGIFSWIRQQHDTWAYSPGTVEERETVSRSSYVSSLGDKDCSKLGSDTGEDFTPGADVENSSVPDDDEARRDTHLGALMKLVKEIPEFLFGGSGMMSSPSPAGSIDDKAWLKRPDSDAKSEETSDSSNLPGLEDRLQEVWSAPNTPSSIPHGDLEDCRLETGTKKVSAEEVSTGTAQNCLNPDNLVKENPVSKPSPSSTPTWTQARNTASIEETIPRPDSAGKKLSGEQVAVATPCLPATRNVTVGSCGTTAAVNLLPGLGHVEQERHSLETGVKRSCVDEVVPFTANVPELPDHLKKMARMHSPPTTVSNVPSPSHAPMDRDPRRPETGVKGPFQENPTPGSSPLRGLVNCLKEISAGKSSPPNITPGFVTSRGVREWRRPEIGVRRINEEVSQRIVPLVTSPTAEVIPSSVQMPPLINCPRKAPVQRQSPANVASSSISPGQRELRRADMGMKRSYEEVEGTPGSPSHLAGLTNFVKKTPMNLPNVATNSTPANLSPSLRDQRRTEMSSNRPHPGELSPGNSSCPPSYMRSPTMPYTRMPSPVSSSTTGSVPMGFREMRRLELANRRLQMDAAVTSSNSPHLPGVMRYSTSQHTNMPNSVSSTTAAGISSGVNDPRRPETGNYRPHPDGKADFTAANAHLHSPTNYVKDIPVQRQSPSHVTDARSGTIAAHMDRDVRRLDIGTKRSYTEESPPSPAGLSGMATRAKKPFQTPNQSPSSSRSSPSMSPGGREQRRPEREVAPGNTHLHGLMNCLKEIPLNRPNPTGPASNTLAGMAINRATTASVGGGINRTGSVTSNRCPPGLPTSLGPTNFRHEDGEQRRMEMGARRMYPDRISTNLCNSGKPAQERPSQEPDDRAQAAGRPASASDSGGSTVRANQGLKKWCRTGKSLHPVKNPDEVELVQSPTVASHNPMGVSSLPNTGPQRIIDTQGRRPISREEQEKVNSRQNLPSWMQTSRNREGVSVPAATGDPGGGSHLHGLMKLTQHLPVSESSPSSRTMQEIARGVAEPSYSAITRLQKVVSGFSENECVSPFTAVKPSTGGNMQEANARRRCNHVECNRRMEQAGNRVSSSHCIDLTDEEEQAFARSAQRTTQTPQKATPQSRPAEYNRNSDPSDSRASSSGCIDLTEEEEMLGAPPSAKAPTPVVANRATPAPENNRKQDLRSDPCIDLTEEEEVRRSNKNKPMDPGPLGSTAGVSPVNRHLSGLEKLLKEVPVMDLASFTSIPSKYARSTPWWPKSSPSSESMDQDSPNSDNRSVGDIRVLNVTPLFSCLCAINVATTWFALKLARADYA